MKKTHEKGILKMLTVNEAAGRAGCDPVTVLYAIKWGDLPAKKWGRDWQITEADFKRWTKNRRKRGRPRKGGDQEA